MGRTAIGVSLLAGIAMLVGGLWWLPVGPRSPSGRQLRKQPVEAARPSVQQAVALSGEPVATEPMSRSDAAFDAPPPQATSEWAKVQDPRLVPRIAELLRHDIEYAAEHDPTDPEQVLELTKRRGAMLQAAAMWHVAIELGEWSTVPPPEGYGRGWATDPLRRVQMRFSVQAPGASVTGADEYVWIYILAPAPAELEQLSRHIQRETKVLAFNRMGEAFRRKILAMRDAALADPASDREWLNHWFPPAPVVDARSAHIR